MVGFDHCLNCSAALSFHYWEERVKCSDCGREYRLEQHGDGGYKLFPKGDEKCITRQRLEILREFTEENK